MRGSDQFPTLGELILADYQLYISAHVCLTTSSAANTKIDLQETCHRQKDRSISWNAVILSKARRTDRDLEMKRLASVLMGSNRSALHDEWASARDGKD